MLNHHSSLIGSLIHDMQHVIKIKLHLLVFSTEDDILIKQ